MGDLCCMCGVEDTHEWFWRSSFGTVWCDNGCEDFATDSSIDLWPVQLGLSIRRFLRRAEVEGLVADVRHETLRHDYHCNNRRSGCGCRGDRAQSALDRLAALALGGAMPKKLNAAQQRVFDALDLAMRIRNTDNGKEFCSTCGEDAGRRNKIRHDGDCWVSVAVGALEGHGDG